MKTPREEQMSFYVADFETTTPKPTLYSTEEIIEGNLLPEIELEPDYHAVSEHPLTAWEDNNDAHVWLWMIAPVLESPTADDVKRGATIATFFYEIETNCKDGDIFFFHNLKFDASFIIPALPQMEIEWDPMTPMTDARGKKIYRPDPDPNKYSYLCSDTGTAYELKITFASTFRKAITISFRDSYKLIPGSVESIAKDLKTKAKKLVGTVDYTKDRPVGYTPTPKEVAYGDNDVLIMSEALHKMFVQLPILQESLTIGGAAMKEFYRTLGECPPMGGVAGANEGKHIKTGKAMFREMCPVFPKALDAEFRPAYRGGFCINASTGEVIDEEGHTLDVNSLYPSTMARHRFPIGYPLSRDVASFNELRFTTEYFVCFDAEFEVKPNHVPFLQESNGRFGDQTHITSSNGTMRRTLCRPDYELFLEQYDVFYIDIVTFSTFDSIDNLFDRFVDKFYAMKNSNKVDGVVLNPVMYLFAKLMLNNLYGKMGQAPDRSSGVPQIDDKGALRFTSTPSESDGGYIPIGSYITAYARAVTIRGAQAIIGAGGIFDYADTDSLHVRGLALEIIYKILNVGDELGQWDHELTWDKARFVRQKTYMERGWKPGHPERVHVSIKACGAPDAVKERLLYKVTTTGEDGNPIFNAYTRNEKMEIINEKRTDDEVFDRFTHGMVEAGKLMSHAVSGGTQFRHTTFRIS